MATSGDEIVVAQSMATLPLGGQGPGEPPPLPPGVPPPPATGVVHTQKPMYEMYKPQNVGSVGLVGGAAQPPMAQGGSLVDNARRGPQPTICEHQLPKSKCKKCKAMARICKHGKKKELCRECDGSALCIHELRKKVPAPCVHTRALSLPCVPCRPPCATAARPSRARRTRAHPAGAMACRNVGSAMAPPCASTTKFGVSVKIVAAAATVSTASASAGLSRRLLCASLAPSLRSVGVRGGKEDSPVTRCTASLTYAPPRRCRDCGGMDFCEHDRRKGQCKECGGSQICHHNRQKFRCKDCFM
jgi:hypothetical protein